LRAGLVVGKSVYRFFFGFFCSFFIDLPFDIPLSFCWLRASVLLIGLFARLRHGNRRLLLVALDHGLGTNFRAVRILAELPAGPPLAQQIP